METTPVTPAVSEPVPPKPAVSAPALTPSSAPAAKPTTSQSVVGPQAQEARQGRLFGWLVSYASANGQAIPLVEGRYFITRSGLKSNDLILNDGSVSTPHCMLTVSVDTGLVVQDLLSEHGVFVKRRGAGNFEREQHAVNVEHGDLVKFGSVEFVVALVPHVGQR